MRRWMTFPLFLWPGFLAAHCGGSTSTPFFTLPDADGGGFDAATMDASSVGDVACSSECAGKCGQFVGTCGQLLSCGTCAGGETCGGGGPNICGSNACTPSCVGKACGASDGCGGICSTGACPVGFYCASNQCFQSSKVVLYGGYSPGAPEQNRLFDTWEWDGTTWTQRTSQTNPGARSDHTMASAFAHRVILYGGQLDGVDSKDTWAWDGTNWAYAVNSKTAPLARSRAAMTMVNSLVLFGGENHPFQQPITYDGDTWELATSGWFDDRIGGGPPARSGHAMATWNNEAILFGGYANGTTETYFNDTWSWNGRWVNVTPVERPPPRQGHAMASLTGKVVLFGGGYSTSKFGDTWQWGGTWVQSHPSVSPSARSDFAMATLGNTVVLFGGLDAGGTYLNDTWEWDGSHWTQRFPATSPPPRARHAMATLTH